MAIHAYTGLPGDGKSYASVAHVIIPALQRERRVVTNVVLKRDALRETAPGGEIVVFPVDEVADRPELIWKYVTPGSVFVLDEVWKLWPAGMKTVNVPEPYKQLIAEHRHMVDAQGRALQIVLVTQDLADIAAFCRNKVAVTFHHMKLDHLGLDKRFRVDVYRGAVTGQQPPKARLLRSVQGKYEERVYRCYTSHTKSEAIEAGADERSMDRRANVWRRPSVLVGAAAVVLCLIWGGSAVAGFFGVGEAPLAVERSATVERAPPTPAVSAPASPYLMGAQTGTPAARVGAVVQRQDGTGYAAIVQGDRTHRVELSQCWQEYRDEWHCTWRGQVVMP